MCNRLLFLFLARNKTSRVLNARRNVYMEMVYVHVEMAVGSESNTIQYHTYRLYVWVLYYSIMDAEEE